MEVLVTTYCHGTRNIVVNYGVWDVYSTVVLPITIRSLENISPRPVSFPCPHESLPRKSFTETKRSSTRNTRGYTLLRVNRRRYQSQSLRIVSSHLLTDNNNNPKLTEQESARLRFHSSRFWEFQMVQSKSVSVSEMVTNLFRNLYACTRL